MKESKKVIVAAAVGTVFALTVISACGKASDAAKADGATTAKTSESVSVTNDNGSVTRSFTECNVTTNGSMVTERRRETRTTTDTAGNVLETSTSEYAQSYPVGDVGLVSLAKEAKADENAAAKADNSSFLGLEFGSVFEGTNFELGERQYSDGDNSKAQELANTLIANGVVAIYGTNDGATNGAAAAGPGQGARPDEGLKICIISRSCSIWRTRGCRSTQNSRNHSYITAESPIQAFL